MFKRITYCTLVVSLVQGILGGLMFWWLIPGTLLRGTVMAAIAALMDAARRVSLDEGWAILQITELGSPSVQR